MDSCNDYPIRLVPGEDIPNWEQPKLPEEGYLLMVSNQLDHQCGETLPMLYHLPISMLTPGGSFQPNVYSADSHGLSLSLPSNQVRAAYVYSNTPYDIRLAKPERNSYAQFLILGVDKANEGNLLIQNSAFYTFPSGHDYIPGYTYYLGQDGVPTSASDYHGGVRQKLFTVIDRRTIAIDIDLEKE